MIELFARYIIPAAYSILPPEMNSRRATAMLLAIGLIESGFRERRQLGGGPARSFMMFERGGGVRGIVTHPDTRDHLRAALVALRYEKMIGQTVLIYQVLEHNDILSAVAARLLLWTVPSPLPARGAYDHAWQNYVDGWRPGKPHRSAFNGHFDHAWDIVEGEDI